MIKDQRVRSVLAVGVALGAIVLVEGCTSGGSRPPKAPPDGTITVEGLDRSRVRFKRAGRKLVADLAEEISGCTGRLYDPMVNEESEGGADLEIVDETTKAPYTYMVLLATAPTNCNIQGICGAAKDTTLIWLKFTEKLSLASRQAFAIEDCRAGRSTKVERGEYPDDEIRAKNLPWVNGVLQIDFDEELAQKSIPTLIYDRQNPEAGLQRMDR